MEIVRIVHECDAGMRAGVRVWRNEVNHGNPNAIDFLKRAVRLPYRVEARIQDQVTKYGASIINQALAQLAPILGQAITLGDLASELNTLKTYSDTLKDNYLNQGWTAEQVAQDIEANAAQIDLDEKAPIPPAYVDDM